MARPRPARRGGCASAAHRAQCRALACRRAGGARRAAAAHHPARRLEYDPKQRKPAVRSCPDEQAAGGARINANERDASVRIVSADDLARVLSPGALIDALADAFRADIVVPDRHAHMIPQPSGSEAKLLLMPAWTLSGERLVGCKVVSVYPDNARAGKPSVYGSYLLMSGDTGEALALMDGTALTAWRTAAASALAARYLARDDAEHLVMVGAGALAPHLIRAHSAVRPIKRVTLWNRTRSRAVSTAFALHAAGIEPLIADDLEAAVRTADVVSCATLSTAPVVRGTWPKQGAH